MQAPLDEMERRLVEMENRLARARALVGDQKERLEILKRKKGRDTSQAERILDAFVAALASLERAADSLHQEADSMVRQISMREPLWIDRRAARARGPCR